MRWISRYLFLMIIFLVCFPMTHSLSSGAIALKSVIVDKKSQEAMPNLGNLPVFRMLLSELMHDGLSWSQIGWVADLLKKSEVKEIADVGEVLEFFSYQFKKFWETCREHILQRKPFNPTHPISNHERSWFFAVREDPSGPTLHEYADMVKPISSSAHCSR